MKQTESNNRQVAFLGKITASMTHELKNVLAIIKESSGLMQDILAFSSDGTCSYEDKLKEILQTIGSQVERGVKLTSRLNRVAHDPDELIKSIELNDLVAHLVALSTRFAQLKKIDLVFASSEIPIVVQTHPMPFQMALFTGIECCFAAMPSGGRIDIQIETGNGENGVIISCHGPDLEDISFSKSLAESHEWALFLDLVEEIAGRHELDASLRRLSVFLPEVEDGEIRRRESSNSIIE